MFCQRVIFENEQMANFDSIKINNNSRAYEITLYFDLYTSMNKIALSIFAVHFYHLHICLLHIYIHIHMCNIYIYV